MKTNKLISILFAILLISCSNDEPYQNTECGKTYISFNVDNVVKITYSTRETGELSSENLTSFVVYGYTSPSPSGTKKWVQIFENGEIVTKSGDDWEYVNKEYWIENNGYRFFAYAPQEAITYTTVALDKIPSGTLTFDNSMNGASGNIDLLWAYTPVADGGPIVNKVSGVTPNSEGSYDKANMNFRHLLSRVKFRFENRGNYSITDVTLNEIITKGKISISSELGKAKTSGGGDTDDYTDLAWSSVGESNVEAVNFGDVSPLVESETESTIIAETKRLFIIPDVVEKQYEVTYVVTDENNVSHKFKTTYSKQSLKKGYSYTFVIDLNSEAIANAFVVENSEGDGESDSIGDNDNTGSDESAGSLGSGSDSSDDSTAETQSDVTRSVAPMKAKVKTRIIEEPM